MTARSGRPPADALALLLSLHMATSPEELHDARMAALTSGIPAGRRVLNDQCPQLGRNGAAVGCPRDRDEPLKHMPHAPLTFAARIGNLTRRFTHQTGHDPEATP